MPNFSLRLKGCDKKRSVEILMEKEGETGEEQLLECQMMRKEERKIGDGDAAAEPSTGGV